MIDYTLAVLTHGDGHTLDQAIQSFQDKVKPAPARIIVYSDGPATTWFSSTLLCEHTLIAAERQRGFCRATGSLWKHASDPSEDPSPFTFWLEHDFVFLRPVDLAELAGPLVEEKDLAQMALMRGPVSREEIAAGGLYELRYADYEPRIWLPDGDAIQFRNPAEARDWRRHRSYFTTNPSLMRTDFMSWNQWPLDEAGQCEGRFGIDLIQRGFSFGVWGAGEPWVEHVGRRGDGFGY